MAFQIKPLAICPDKKSGGATGRSKTPGGRPFVQKFLVIALGTVLPLSLAPEPWYAGINHFTAFFVTMILQAMAMEATATASLITLDGFSVRVISECSAVHLAALYGAFVASFPADRHRKWMGFGIGPALLFLLNAGRIAMVTVIGRYIPALFTIAHLYLGQVGMISATVGLCVFWCRWASSPQQSPKTGRFMARAIVFGSLFFLPWLRFNRPYVAAIDFLVQWFYHLGGYALTLPHAHRYYYQTFSIIPYFGLVMAPATVPILARLKRLGFGLGILVVFHLLHRLCNVWLSGFKIGWVAPVSQVVYVSGMFILPVYLALTFILKNRYVSR